MKLKYRVFYSKEKNLTYTRIEHTIISYKHYLVIITAYTKIRRNFFCFAFTISKTYRCSLI